MVATFLLYMISTLVEDPSGNLYHTPLEQTDCQASLWYCHWPKKIRYILLNRFINDNYSYKGNTNSLRLQDLKIGVHVPK